MTDLRAAQREQDGRPEKLRSVPIRQVEVECSPFGMVHWALQYSDRVEVLAPEELREEIREEVRKLEEKYLGEGK